MSYNIVNIDDDPEFLTSIKLLLKKRYPVQTATTLSEGLQLIRQNSADLVLLDVSIGRDENGIDGLRQIKQLSPDTDVVMITADKDPKTVVEAIRAGALDYLCKPFDPEDLLAVIEKSRVIKEMKDRNNALIEGLNPIEARQKILGAAPAFRQMLEKTNRLKGHTEANVLILGESGTGKELLARHIHSLEEEPRRPFIAVNCAAIPEGLIEAELFGFERGAFTGAHQRKIGKFELASNGDIFLDEISSLRPDLQAKILRVIQEKEIVRVGGNTTIPVDFRVISATNEEPARMVEENRFRPDLYHRLRVVELRIPPLRERKSDIPLLVAHFLDRLGRKKGVKKISPEALQKLQEYPWPGNVRELENVIHSLTILSEGDLITDTHLPHWMNNYEGAVISGSAEDRDTLRLPRDLSTVQMREFIRDAERIYIRRVLEKNGGDKSKTAESLKIGRTTLYGKLKELGLFD